MNRRAFLKLTIGGEASLWLAKAGLVAGAAGKKPAPPRASIIIPNWNGLALLRPCLDSLRRQTCQDERRRFGQVCREYLDRSFEARIRAAQNRVMALRARERVEAIYEVAAQEQARVPDQLRLATGSSTTIRGALGEALRHLNKASGGALLTASADLYGSTSVSAVAADFPPGFYNAVTAPDGGGALASAATGTT